MKYKQIASISLALAVLGILMSVSGVSIANGVWHSVHVGGPDACTGIGMKPGCDANYSFSALLFEDGTVRGQYNDRYPDGTGVHGKIDCLFVEDNIAHVSGPITKGFPDGWRFYALAADNGRNANDPPDQIGITFALDPEFLFDCNEIPFAFPSVFDWLADMPEGQVTVK